MSFAPHSNTDIANGANLPLILGSFRNARTNATFEYAIRPYEGVDFAPDAMHVVYVGPHAERRYARVLKTVAYIAVDETADGEPVWDKWEIASHREYPTEWVRVARGEV